MKWIVMIAMCTAALSWNGAAQESAAPASNTKGTTLIGCLAGPDSDDRYTLTSMQHRLGVEVVGSDELKQGAGGKVKLTGSWEPIPSPAGKKGDATRRFKATAITVLEDKCQSPAPVTPVSKKKQEQEKEKQAQPQ